MLNVGYLTSSIQIWSMKKNEDQAAKKRPKTSAAQIRVQKGAPLTPTPLDNVVELEPLITYRSD